MDYQTKIENAVAAIRVSSVKQGIQGDSPEAQKEQIEQFARTHNIHIKKFFIFLESASKEEQPVQEAIDYCKHPKNDIQIFIIKSIDRFTRGGSFFYDSLKRQLELNKVKLVDIYGIIGTHSVNTLEHLGVEFDWSVYSPTKKAEILEAERAKDEMRDIMSRMIGAEIRYSRMGYWVRRSPFGYVNEKIETPNGKRTILKPHPTESKWIIKMFHLRKQGTHTDRQIVKIVNDMGYKTRIELMRDPEDRTKIIRKKGGNPLTLKVYWEYIKNPVYAGIHAMNWTKKTPVKAKYDGLVSVETFNKANRGRVVISEEDHEIKIYQNINPRYLVKQGIRNPDFPYKRVVLCPKCNRPFFGSASRGRLGKYYPAYHCNKRGHYFRIPKKDFEDNIVKLVRSLEVTQPYIETLVNTVTTEWEKRQKESKVDQSTFDTQIDNLKGQVRITVDKIKLLSSETAIKYMEEDITKLEQEIANLLNAKQKAMISKPMDAHVVMAYVRYFLEHFDNLLLDWEDPEERASHFGVLFDETPTYQEILSGTPKLSEFIKLKEVFMRSESDLAGRPGLEPGFIASKAIVLPLDDLPIKISVFYLKNKRIIAKIYIDIMYELSNINYMQKNNLPEEDQPPSTLRAHISPHLKRLIKSSPALFKEFVPSTKENQSEIQVFSDPLCEDKFIKTKGLVHKYPGRVLIELTLQCASYCRFCTRRRKVSDIEHGKLSDLDMANIIKYLQDRRDVTELVISGGDPFTVPKQLVQFIKLVDKIETIKIIRIHTRVPVSYPQSIPDYIYSALSKIKKTLYLSIHFEHPDELTKPTLAAVKKLKQTGAILLSQAVFLKGINDDYEILHELFTRLAQLGIRPYYIYRCDPVAGAAHFIVPFAKEVAIMTKLRANLSGIAFPTYVIDAPNGSGKVPVPLDFWEFNKNKFYDFEGNNILI